RGGGSGARHGVEQLLHPRVDPGRLQRDRLVPVRRRARSGSAGGEPRYLDLLRLGRVHHRRRVALRSLALLTEECIMIASQEAVAADVQAERSSTIPGLREGQTPTVLVDQVSKWYGDIVAVSNVTFGVAPGVTGLLGPNGAGKS